MDEVLIKRILPHSDEAEQAVIASMLMDKDAVVTAVDMLEKEDFYSTRYGILFEAMDQLSKEGKPADLIQVQDRVRQNGAPPEVSGMEFLREILSSVPTSANIRHYAEIVKNKSILRRLIKTAQTIENECYESKDNIENIDGKLVYVSVEEENSRSIVDFSTNEGTNELTDIMGRNSSFNNPKNLDLIKYLLSLVPNKNSVVLDFFAGSGTTAQAVIELNKEDGGNRRFILCTNNENEICDNVTYPRIKTVISGKRADGSTYSDGLPANLKYYRTDFVSRDEEFLSDALLEHIAEMIQLEHGVKIDGSQYLMVMSDKEADELQKHFGEYSGVIALYVSKNVLLTTQQLKTFEGVEIHIIPDNYFKFELKEEGQAW